MINMTLELANLFGKILLMMGFGFLLAKRRIMTEDMKRHLSDLLIKAILPVNIISSAGQTLSGHSAKGMLQVLLISSIYYLISLILMNVVVKIWKKNDGFCSIFINTAVFANVGFIGFPILGELFGEIGTLYTIAYNMSFQLFFFSYGVFLMEGKGKLSFKNLFGNSIIYVSIASILLYISGLRFPGFIQSTLTTIGGMMVPLSMMIIGWEIANTKIKEILSDKYSYLVSVLRLLIFPVMVAILLKLFRVERDVAIASVLLSALPSGSLTVILSQEYNRDTCFAAKAVAQSTFFMVVTLPVLFVFANYLF